MGRLGSAWAPLKGSKKVGLVRKWAIRGKGHSQRFTIGLQAVFTYEVGQGYGCSFHACMVC